MSAATESLDPAEVKRLAEAWFARQVALAERCLGSAWPEHREWIIAYLREEIRLRLIERYGWRPKR